jgi:hypothetical protein
VSLNEVADFNDGSEQQDGVVDRQLMDNAESIAALWP